MAVDAFGRPLRDLRISVTDRCNFRCTYCMPKEVFGRDFAFLDRAELLSFEEIARLTQLFVREGVQKIRLTGGEPLLRRDIERLVAMLDRIRGVQDIALTTNGALLTRDKAFALRDAGLKRITVSLDALDDAVFRRMNDVEFPVARVLEAIDAAEEAGLSPIKIDVVVKRGENDNDIVEIARRFRGSGHIVRFIEYMDVGNTNGWQMADVVSAREIADRIAAHWPIEPLQPNYFGEVAERMRYVDGGGEIGIISSVTQPFCGSCTRARLSADGKLYLCLFSGTGHDLRALLRAGADDEEIASAIRSHWHTRDDRYSEIRAEATPGTKVEMSHIGG
ncbi:MAG TPA: GTP 3',8-cyclase MoaA [Thermoanaerobaculia bacterium]|jgi:cyclic pyranopterin phosphate synthase|nr:GTP 3',8-cyclase MoaA [Thermoanaerobaculia bacterium]